MLWRKNDMASQKTAVLHVQLFEVTLDIIFFDICFFIRKRQQTRGYVFPVFTIMHGFSSYLWAFAKESTCVLWKSTSSQIISAIVIGIAFLLIDGFKKASKKVEQMRGVRWRKE